MRKVMIILAVAALSASTAFAGGVEEATQEAPVLAQEPSGGMVCTNSVGEIVTCAVVVLCAGGLCGAGGSSSSSSSSSSSN
jgi:hypothetical protein